MKIYNNITELVGNTPLLRLNRFEKFTGSKANIIAKLEYLNPAGSVKDRVGVNMIKEAIESGTLMPGATIIEPTSGNTGIGIAMAAVTYGFRTILTMPETMSIERRMLLSAYGAEIVLTEGALGMNGAIAKAYELSEQIPGSVILGQFENPANPEVHYKTTGPEIYNDTDGEVDIIVAGAGTGGTVSGVARYIKEKKPTVKIVAVEPAGSAVISGKAPGAHGLMGIGAGFIPDTLDTAVLDEVITVTDNEAYTAARELAGTEGFLCGISGGAALHAAKIIAQKEENAGKSIVVILPDNGERYLSTPLWSKNN
ncbi:MAG: cysteine synthase A [Clostridia bacterium]|nr:cysteine synthase A [Clostridia bacterium]